MVIVKTETELRARLAELNDKIAKAPGWGAALGAMDEERREIKSKLTSIRAPIISDPARAAALADLQRAYAHLDRVYEYFVGPRSEPSRVLPSRPSTVPMPSVKPTLGTRAPPREPPPDQDHSLNGLPRVHTPRKWWEVWKW